MKPNRGFTLVEMVLSMVLISLTIFGTASIIIRGLDSFGLARERRQAVNAARYALDRMTREMREIASSASIIDATSNMFRFTQQLNEIRYDISPDQLTRNNDLLAGNLMAGSRFTYFDAWGLQPLRPTDIARVRIDLRVDTRVAAYGSVQMVTDVYLRNLHYKSFTQP